MYKNLNPSGLGVSGHQSEIIELALTYGFSSMDVNITEFAARARLKGTAYAKRLIQSAQIRIGTFPLPLEWDTDDATFQRELKKLPELAGYAAELGCTRATALVAPAGDTRPYHENFEFHRPRFHDIAAALRPAGVHLALGFQAAETLRQNRAFQFIHDLDALTLLVNMIAAPNVGFWLDIWEVVAAGGSPEGVRKLPPGQIVAVQVANMPADAAGANLDEKARLLPDAENGRIDVVEFLKLLREAGYAGPVTAKPSRSVFQSRRRDNVVKQTGESLDKVFRAAGIPVPVRPVLSAPED